MNPTAMNAPRLSAVRGEIVHFLADPAADPRALEHFADGVLIVRDGHVAECGPAAALLTKLPSGTPLADHRGRLILPGFVDTHVHYPQTDIIASHGEQLLEWLERYTFPAERRFADPAHAAEVAGFFCDELLRNGTTTAAAFATVHPASVEALFTAAQARRMRLITGKVLMDRNCPDFLRDTAETGYAESRALIERWHNRDRLLYAITPRFAPTSTPAQMALAGRLFREHPGVFLQSHLAENRAEVDWVARLHPEARSYLDVYERAGQLGMRALFAHCLWLDDSDRRRMAERGAAMSFCPTSNLFLGSGLFDLACAWAWARTWAAAPACRCCRPSTRPTRCCSSAASRCRRRAVFTSPPWAARTASTSTTASATSRPARRPTSSSSTHAPPRCSPAAAPHARRWRSASSC